MSRSNWLPNEKLCLKRLKKNGESVGFDKSKYHKDIILDLAIYIITISDYFSMEIMLYTYVHLLFHSATTKKKPEKN